MDRLPFHRLPLGEKGLVRFAVHKLGNKITLITRAAKSQECVVEIDWDELIEKPFLDEAPVRIKLRDPLLFKGKSTGTRIEISDIRQETWTRGESFEEQFTVLGLVNLSLTSVVS